MIDLKNRKFGKLLVISKYIGERPADLRNRKQQGCLWICECECGKTKIKLSSDLIHGGDETCGCYRADLKKHSNKWCGYEDISGEYWGRIKSSARKRNLEFALSIKDAWDIFINQNRKCKLSGMDICFAPSRREASNGTASIDRIDSTKGYIPSNIQWLHKDINRLKDHFSDDRLKQLCSMVYLHNIK